MKAEVDAVLKAGDTVGGIFEIVATMFLSGWASHAQWDEKLDGRLAQALMSVQAVKAVEIGGGVAGAGSFGSEVQDEISTKSPRDGSGAIPTAREDWKAESPTGKTCGSRVLEADLDFAPAVAYYGHGHQRAGQGGLRALGLVRGAGRSSGGRSHGGTCAGGCFSAKIWGDSLAEMQRNFDNYARQIDEF